MMRLSPPFDILFGTPFPQLSIIAVNQFVIVRAITFLVPVMLSHHPIGSSTIHGPWDSESLPLIKEDTKC